MNKSNFPRFISLDKPITGLNGSRIMKYSNFLRFIPDQIYIRMLWRAKMHTKLNLANPQTFNEKLQWLKLNDRKPQYTQMVDKAAVKEYVASIIGDKYIIPTLYTYEYFEDIDFSRLPDQFVLKCTHDSGGLCVCRDKAQFDIEAARNKLNKSLHNNFFYYGREYPYKDVPKKIICEKYMQDGQNLELRDYKFYCFNGDPKFLYLSEGMENHKTAKISFVNMDWSFAPFHRTDYASFSELPAKPDKFDEMLDIAKKLSNGIPFIRVDLYEINDQVFFGELTFTPCAGFMPFSPPEWDLKIGEMLSLNL